VIGILCGLCLQMKNGATEAPNNCTTVGNEEHNAKGGPNLTQVWDAFLNHENKEGGSIGIVTSSSDHDSSVSVLERFFGSALSKPSAPSTSFVQIEVCWIVLNSDVRYRMGFSVLDSGICWDFFFFFF
jgi:hypothetical protein